MKYLRFRTFLYSYKIETGKCWTEILFRSQWFMVAFNLFLPPCFSFRLSGLVTLVLNLRLQWSVTPPMHSCGLSLYHSQLCLSIMYIRPSPPILVIRSAIAMSVPAVPFDFLLGTRVSIFKTTIIIITQWPLLNIGRDKYDSFFLFSLLLVYYISFTNSCVFPS